MYIPRALYLFTVFAIFILIGCKKSPSVDIGRYTSRMVANNKLWSGSNVSYGPFDSIPVHKLIVDASYTIQVTGSATIKFDGTDMVYSKTYNTINAISFIYTDGSAYPESTAELVYYADNDSMTFSSKFSHHSYYGSYFIHTN